MHDLSCIRRRPLWETIVEFEYLSISPRITLDTNLVADLSKPRDPAFLRKDIRFKSSACGPDSLESARCTLSIVHILRLGRCCRYQILATCLRIGRFARSCIKVRLLWGFDRLPSRDRAFRPLTRPLYFPTKVFLEVGTMTPPRRPILALPMSDR